MKKVVECEQSKQTEATFDLKPVLFGPRHDKTNKMSVHPAKTQISLGIRQVWSESSLSAWRKLGSLATHWAQAKTLIRLGGCPGWSESSLGAQSFCWFCHEAAQFSQFSNVASALGTATPMKTNENSIIPFSKAMKGLYPIQIQFKSRLSFNSAWEDRINWLQHMVDSIMQGTVIIVSLR